MKIKTIRNVLAIALLSFGAPLFAQEATQASVGTLDIDLAKAIDIALDENPTIKVADKEIALKQVANTEAWQSLLPSVSANLALSNSIKVAAIKTGMGEFKMGIDGATTATGALTATLPIFAPAIYANMKLTKEDILLSQEKARSSRLDLINQVTKAYYAALLAKDSYEVMQKSYNVSKQNFDVVNNKFNVGSVSEYDKISAEVQTRAMNSSVVSAKTGLALALLRLKVLMGITENVDLNINDNLRNYEGRLSMADVNNAIMDLDGNSALRQLDHNAALLKRTRNILKTNFMPTVAAQFSYQYQSYSNDNWKVWAYHFTPSSTLSFSVSVPIFTASNWTKMKSNKLQMESLQDTRQNTVNQLKMAVESYRKNMASNMAQVESNKEAVTQANKAVSISSKRYEVGRGTILELNQSETALTQAELTYNQSIYEYLSNKADLDYTLGKETYLK